MSYCTVPGSMHQELHYLLASVIIIMINDNQIYIAL